MPVVVSKDDKIDNSIVAGRARVMHKLSEKGSIENEMRACKEDNVH